MPKVTKENQRLLKEKEKKFLKKRQVHVPICVDDLSCTEFEKSLLKRLLGRTLRVPIDAAHVKEYLVQNFKRDKTLKKSQVIQAQSDITGKHDNKFYNLLHVRGVKISKTDGFLAHVAWRGKDKKGKKFKDSLIKESNFKDSDTVLSHYYEDRALRSALSNYLGMQSHLYTTVNDDEL